MTRACDATGGWLTSGHTLAIVMASSACVHTGCGNGSVPPESIASVVVAPGSHEGVSLSNKSNWRKVAPEQKTTPLISALLDRDLEHFKNLLNAGADPNDWDEYGRNAVIVAAGIPDSQHWLQDVLAHGGNPNLIAPDSVKRVALLGGGLAPLHMAASQPNNELNVRLLVEAGADVNAATAYGMTPLGIAIDGRLFEVAAYLVRHGANPDAKGTGGYIIRETIRLIGGEDDAFALPPEDESSLAYLRETIAAVGEN